MKKTTVWVAEMAVSIGAVLVFFLLFLGIMSISFPQGTGLRGLLTVKGPSGVGSRGGLDFHLADEESGDTIQMVAHLTEVYRKVKDKRASAISWRSARRGIPLENRHSVQTFTKSSAKISFDDDNTLDLSENSLVIIRKMEQTSDFTRRSASVVVLDGSLTGTVAANGRDLELEIVTPGAVSRIRSDHAEDTDFTIIHNDDNSSSIAVYSGQAEVKVTGATETIQVPEKHVVMVDEQGNIFPPMRIPAVPALVTPATRETFSYRAAPPQVEMAWEESDSALTYRLQIAEDEDFDRLLLEREVTNTSFVHGNLKDGRYYWRVTAANEGMAGLPGPTRLFDVVRDEEPPMLQVRMPEPDLHDSSFRLTGVTEPGAEVFVGDSTVSVSPTGEFEIDLTLDPGPNVLVVEAFDSVGNVAYVSQLVHVKPR